MAAGTIIGAGFKIDPAKAAAAAAQTAEPVESAEQELARMVMLRLGQGSPQSAMAAAVELVNSIAAKYDLNGGAWL